MRPGFSFSEAFTRPQGKGGEHCSSVETVGATKQATSSPCRLSLRTRTGRGTWGEKKNKVQETLFAQADHQGVGSPEASFDRIDNVGNLVKEEA